MQVVQAPLHETSELGPLRWPVQHGLEGLAAHLRVGHPGVGELADVGRDAIQLIEGQPP
jgi:hypothetical protein